MNDLADVIARWLQVAARTSPFQWLLRLVLLVAGTGVCLLTQNWLDVFISPLLFALAAVALVASAIKPDTGLPAVFVVIVLLWWLIGGWHAPWWQAAAVAIGLALVHQASAWAATGPSHQTVRRAALAPLGRAAALYLVACLAAIGVVAGVSQVSPTWVARGWVWIVLAVAAVAVVAGRVLPRRR
ncbi:hypothetical protein ACSDQ9_03910 [Aestuariimicrobium soli]|uniref:hypothetical protein n=1 Tax=Aestuariimicrobium soli TaxID=2035834 RepID=UPI003EC09A02